MMKYTAENESLAETGDDDDEVIGQALQMLKELDNTPLSEMSPLFTSICSNS